MDKSEKLEKTRNLLDDVGGTFTLLMSVENGRLETPTQDVLGFSGEMAEAREKLETVTDTIEENGYTVTTEHVETTEMVPDYSEYNRFRIDVVGEYDPSD